MEKGQLDLIEKLIDLKLKRAFLAAQVSMQDGMSGFAIINLMLPVEQELELTRQALIRL